MLISQPVNEKFTNYSTITKVKEDPNDYTRRKTKNHAKTRLLKRIPLERLMDLKIDYAFKQLFGNEKNKDITVVFLNAILQKTGRNRIKDISFKNTESGAEYIDDKQSRLDLLVVTDTDEWINVEIQLTNKYDMVKRSIFYWSRAYQNPLEKGMTYKELRPVIAINILNFNLFSQTEHFHTSYHLYEDEDQFKLTNVMEFHYIEMAKLIKDWKDDQLNPWDNVLARWLLMLGMVDHRNRKVYDNIYMELEEISMKDETLRSAFQNWEELSMTQEQYLAYESRLKRIMDDEAFQREMELQKIEIEKGKSEIEKGKSEIEKGKSEIEKGKSEIEKGKSEIEKEQIEIENRKTEIGKRTKEVEQRINDANQKEIETAQKENDAEQRVIRVAHQLLAKGMEIEFVVEATGLTKDKVIGIKCDLQK